MELYTLREIAFKIFISQFSVVPVDVFRNFGVGFVYMNARFMFFCDIQIVCKESGRCVGILIACRHEIFLSKVKKLIYEMVFG